MSKVEKKDPIGDFFKNIFKKSKDTFKNVSSSEAVKDVKSKAKGKELYIAGGGFILLALVLFLLFGTNTFETPIKNIVKGINTANFKTSIQAIPPFMVDKEFKTSSMEEAEKEFLDRIVNFREEYGQNYQVRYRIIEKKRIELNDLHEVENDILSYYSEKVRITDGYKLRLSTSISGDKKSEEHEITYRVYKINGKWYTNRLF